MLLLEDEAFTTRKSVMVVVVRGPFLAEIDKIIAPTGCYPENHFNSMGDGSSWLRSIHIFARASQKRMSAELPLSIKTL